MSELLTQPPTVFDQHGDDLDRGPEPELPTGEKPIIQTEGEITQIVNGLPIREVTSKDRDAVLLYPDEDESTAADKVTGILKQEAWWNYAFDTERYIGNPFDHMATEQFSFGVGEKSVKLLNFSDALTEAQTEEIRAALEMVWRAVGDPLFEAAPWMVIHPNMEIWPEISAYTGKGIEPLGVAHGVVGRGPFIQLNDKLTDSIVDEKVLRVIERIGLDPKTTSAMQVIIVHELGHMLDPYGSGGTYGRDLGWEEHRGIRGISELKSEVQIQTEDGETIYVPLKSAYTDEEQRESAPASDYGYISGSEDFAEAFVLLVLAPDKLDPIRRDLLMLDLGKRTNRRPASQLASELTDRDLHLLTKRNIGQDIEYPRVQIPKEIVFRRLSRESIAKF